MINFSRAIVLFAVFSPLLHADFGVVNRFQTVFPSYQQVADQGDSAIEALQQMNSSAGTPDCRQPESFHSHCLDGGRKNLMRRAILGQIKYLGRLQANQAVSSKLSIKNSHLMTTLHQLLAWVDNPAQLQESFELIGLDRTKSEVAFTGYYTPVLSARYRPDAEYRYPVYRPPLGQKKFLSRARIESGGLRGLGLEIAWVKDPVGLFYLHLQGSGVLEFPGYRKIVRYTDSNGKPFRSIAKYMQQKGYIHGSPSRRAITAWLQRNPGKMREIFAQNPRFIFFAEADRVTSASGAELIPGHSVAVDTSWIPWGSVLLAETPVYKQSRMAGYEWRLLFPHDRGYAIRGPRRMDIYTGEGVNARNVANKVTGARRAYLLMYRTTARPAAQIAAAEEY